MIEVAPGVWAAGTRFVNWYVVEDGDGLTVVDAGLPRYSRHLVPVLRRLGRSPEDVRAVVLTHGHVDHTGMAATLAAAGARVHLHPADAPLAERPGSNRTDRPLLPYLRFPATLGFVAHAVAEGATRPAPFPVSVPLVGGAVADVPGRPLVHHVPGHTDGSCVLEFREHGVVFAGDLLCTVSPVLGRPAPPQLQTRGSNTDSDQALASLALVEQLETRTVLPGHGAPWRDGMAAAVASALRVGCR